MTLRKCIAKVSSKSVSEESSLAFIIKYHQVLKIHPSEAATPTRLAAAHASFSTSSSPRDRDFPCKLILISQVHSFKNFLLTHNRHSHRSSNAPTVTTLSPVESQRGFTSLPTISEGGQMSSHGPSTSSSPVLEKAALSADTFSQHSWLKRFLVKTHLSAPLR